MLWPSCTPQVATFTVAGTALLAAEPAAELVEVASADCFEGEAHHVGDRGRMPVPLGVVDLTDHPVIQRSRQIGSELVPGGTLAHRRRTAGTFPAFGHRGTITTLVPRYFSAIILMAFRRWCAILLPTWGL